MTVSNPSSITCDCDCTQATSLESFTNLTSGQTTVSPVFSAQPAEYVIEYAYVENILDVGALTGFSWTCTARGATSFTIKLDSAPDSNNYKLRWKIRTAQYQL